MKSLDWTYITRDRAKENINVIALETISEIFKAPGLCAEDITSRIHGVMMLKEQFVRSLELPEDKDDE